MRMVKVMMVNGKIMPFMYRGNYQRKMVKLFMKEHFLMGSIMVLAFSLTKMVINMREILYKGLSIYKEK